MNSLETLKHELITQKQLLEEKGFEVTTNHTHPSPAEITTAIDNININFPSTTALPEDVRLGKTFYSQDSNIKTGTLDTDGIDNYINLITGFITAVGSFEIQIPTDSQYTQIREYAFATVAARKNLFYKHNLTIPSNITKINTSSFYCCNLTGKVTIPSTCTFLSSSIFDQTNIEELEIYNGISSGSIYLASNCANLKRLIMHAPITMIPNYCFSTNTALQEVYFPSTLETLSSTCLYNCAAILILEFSGDTPPKLSTGTFQKAKNAAIYVPYLKYDDYFNATNYQYYGQPIYGFGQFSQGDTLPSSDEAGLYTITWYSSVSDIRAGTNPITTCPFDGKMYGAFTAVET